MASRCSECCKEQKFPYSAVSRPTFYDFHCELYLGCPFSCACLLVYIEVPAKSGKYPPLYQRTFRSSEDACCVPPGYGHSFVRIGKGSQKSVPRISMSVRHTECVSDSVAWVRLRRRKRLTAHVCSRHSSREYSGRVS